MDTFNIPQYPPSPSEVKFEVQKEGSFTIADLKVSVVPWNGFDSECGLSKSLSNGGYNVAKCMRAVAESMLVSHFGEAIIEEVFDRYQEILTERMSKEKTEFVNISLSVIRRA